MILNSKWVNSTCNKANMLRKNWLYQKYKLRKVTFIRKILRMMVKKSEVLAFLVNAFNQELLIFVGF